MTAHRPVAALRRRSPRTGEPFDLQICGEFLGCVKKSGASQIHTSANLLDAHRSGKDFKTLVMSVLEAARRGGRTELMVDLVSMLPGWGIHGEFPREGLVWIATAALLAADQEDDAMGWMDAFVSLDREGYSLEWLAKRCTPAHAPEWSAVLTAADSLISERLRRAS